MKVKEEKWRKISLRLQEQNGREELYKSSQYLKGASKARTIATYLAQRVSAGLILRRQFQFLH